MQLKLYDYFLILGLVGTTSYIFLFMWMPTMNQEHNSFSMIGAVFGIAMTTLMIKFLIVSTAVGLEWFLPRLSKKFQNIKITQPSFTIFNKRIEIRVVDKHNDGGKVTF